MSLIGKRIGNYEIKAKLGEGGMGAVYLGEHPMIGKKVAIKVLLEELVAKEDIVQRFFNEAKAVNDIGHPNIIDVVDFGKIPGDHGGDVVYFIMEFLEGDSLSHRLRTTGLSQPETMHVIRQCCSGLAASHKKGIIHRDLKPENIYLIARGSDKNFVKILDFGIAKLTGGDGATSSKTRTGLVIGTPTYMSPEQCDGRGLIDSRADIYSLGVVMFELLTGRVPFPGDGFGEVLVAHLTKPPPRPSELNPDIRPEIEAIVMHAIEKDKNRRFQTMEEFEAAVADPAAHAAAYLGGSAENYGGGGVQTVMMGGPPPIVMPGNRTVVGMQSPTRPTTTLSGSSGEVGSGGGGSRVGLFALLFLLLAGAGGGGAYFFLRSQRTHEPQVVSGPAGPSTGPTTAAAAPAAPVDESVVITIASEPKGAKVVRGDTGETAGTTPIDLKLKKGAEAFDVRLTLQGYQPVKRTITAERSKEITVALAPEATAPAPTPATPVAAPAAPTKPAAPSKPATVSKPSKPSKPAKPEAPSTKPKGGKRPADPDAPMDINF